MGNKISRKTLIILLTIFLIALALRAWAFSDQINNMKLSYDPRNYWIMSHQLVDEGIYGYAYDTPSGISNARVMPGYPLFLAAVYKILGDKYLQITAVRMLQILIGSLSVLLAFYLVRKMFEKNSIALLTALFMAIYPTYVLSPVMLLTEPLALFTMLLYFCLAFHSFESGKFIPSLSAGVAFGLHILVRPALLPLFFLPFVFILLTGKKKAQSRGMAYGLRSMSIIFLYQLAGFTAVMAPWWIRNMVTLGSFIITAEGSGNAFLAGTYPYFKDYFMDVTNEIKNSNDTQMAHGIKRLLNGLKTDTWLYIKWFTLGKTAYIFKEPYLYKMIAGIQAPSVITHFATVIPGAVGVILHAFTNIRALWFYLYGLAILGIQLMFVPDPRFAYLVLFFIMVGAAHLVSSLLGLILSGGNRKARVDRIV